MAFIFQEPGGAQLPETIGRVAKKAHAGGAMFAFATPSGVELLIRTTGLGEMLSANLPFTLIVGTDAITNPAALLRLEELSNKHSALEPLAFIHGLRGIFHPKFLWFQRKQDLVLVVGSGNLTENGLGSVSHAATVGGNWEAFGVIELRGSAAKETLASLNQWIAANRKARSLRAVDDPDVRAKAVENSRLRVVKGLHSRLDNPIASTSEVAPAVEVSSVPVLLRELPQNRPGQADIGRNGLRFLGFQGNPVKAILQYVSLDNLPGTPRESALFVNASSNYRVEIPEISDLGYKIGVDDGRMILIATKFDDASFRYALVPATSVNYSAVSALLGPIATRGASRRMRESVTDTAKLLAAWPAVPSGLLPVAAYGVAA